MQLTAEQRSFLGAVHAFNERFTAVRAGDASLALHHPFWSAAEIERAIGIKEGWEVPMTLVPFYGDWHTLICLHPGDGTVQLLDDQRRVVFTWPSTEAFARCLTAEPEKRADTSGIIEAESWLDI